MHKASNSFRKRRVIDAKECKNDLKSYLHVLFNAFRQGIDKFNLINRQFSVDSNIRGSEASLLNRCVTESLQRNLPNNWIFGKYRRFIIRINNYIVLFKKLNKKNMPMNISTKLVNGIMCQQQASLFEEDKFSGFNEPIIFLGYQVDRFGVISDPKLVYIDENMSKWEINSKEFEVSNTNNIMTETLVNANKPSLRFKDREKSTGTN